jgi:Acetyltransferase (GNAT) family
VLEADPTIVVPWVEGWTLSRRVPAPRSIAGGFRIDVGLPEQRVRYILPRLDADALRQVMESELEPGAFIKIFAQPEEVAPLLMAPWTLQAPSCMMITTLSARCSDEQPVPPRYRTSIRKEGAVIVVEVLCEGDRIAARGQMAVHRSCGIADQIRTAPEHRRRGLGSVVMRTLEREAAAAGAETGVLVATQEGYALYSALGWSVHSPYTSAWILTA